jgi:hypothetical protein
MKKNIMSLLVWLATGLVGLVHATIVNPSFELPEIPEDAVPESTPTGWAFFSPGFDTSGVIENAALAQTGDQVLQFYAPDAGTDIGRQGYYQTLTMTLAPGEKIGWQVYLRNSSGLPMQSGVVGILGIEFLRSDLSEINRAELFVGTGQLSTNQWLPFTVFGSPSGEPTAFVRFVVAQEKQTSTANAGIFFAEDAAIVPEPSVIFLGICGAGLLAWSWRRRS